MRFGRRDTIISAAMDHDYDAVIVGGAFSGAATAPMLKRRRPETRVLIIEKTHQFDRKVGESTTELSSCFVPDIRLRHLIRKGLFRWWKCELVNLRLLFVRRTEHSGVPSVAKLRGETPNPKPQAPGKTQAPISKEVAGDPQFFGA